jgi:tetratricopeptide (TPR) repeat protein
VLGRALESQTGRDEETLAAYREAVRLSPYWGTALRGYGLALLAEGQPDESVEILSRAIAVDPDNSAGHYYLALALADAKRWAVAAGAFEAYLQEHPKDVACHRRYGDVLLELGRKAEARAQWTEALRLDPSGSQGRLAKDTLAANP